MKRLLLILLVALLLAACGGNPSAEVATERLEVEVTRLVEVEVEVTRLVEVVVTATPLPTLEPTATPEIDPTIYVVGSNMSPGDLPPGEEGLVVITTGPASDFGFVPIVVRNNTGAPVYNIGISATVRDAAGTIVGTGSETDISPYYVAPGGVAFGEVYFNDVPLNGNTIEYMLTSDDQAGFIFSTLDLEIAEHNLVGGNVVGLMRNHHDTAITLIEGIVACFDDTLTPISVHSSFTAQDRVEAGADIPFSVDLLGREGACGRYLLTGNGLATD